MLQGRGVFVSEQENNPNRLHKNPNCNVEQDSINNIYNTIVIYRTINRTYNVDVPRNKSQKIMMQILNSPSIIERNRW